MSSNRLRSPHPGDFSSFFSTTFYEVRIWSQRFQAVHIFLFKPEGSIFAVRPSVMWTPPPGCRFAPREFHIFIVFIRRFSFVRGGSAGTPPPPHWEGGRARDQESHFDEFEQLVLGATYPSPPPRVVEYFWLPGIFGFFWVGRVRSCSTLSRLCPIFGSPWISGLFFWGGGVPFSSSMPWDKNPREGKG